MRLESTADDLIHTEPFLFSSQEVTEEKCSPEGHLSEDGAVKWLDQFIVWLKYFVKRKIGSYPSLQSNANVVNCPAAELRSI
jgi:hypothetical protein